MSDFRILALDGGGTGGAYIAAVLDEIQITTGKNIAECFDLIVGTSTGGIVALGVGLGFTPSRILQFYQVDAKDVFSPPPVLGLPPSWQISKWTRPISMRTRSLFRNVRQAFYGAKHNVERLEQHLVATFQQRKFGESETPLVIVSYNPSRPNPGLHLFKSNTERDSSRPAVDVALAATAAPTYFNARDLLLGTKYEALLDGGIAANCPVFVGLAEAVHTFHKNLGDVRILSIGTTYKPVVITRRQKTGGLSAYSRFGIILGLGLVDLLMSAQVATTVGTANFLLQDRFRRVTHQTEEEIKLDDIANMDKMVEWARDDAEKDMEAIQREFFA